MNITPTDIKKFKRLYVEEFNKKLSDDDAQELLSALLRQVQIAYQPISINQLSKLRDLNGNTNGNLIPTN